VLPPQQLPLHDSLVGERVKEEIFGGTARTVVKPIELFRNSAWQYTTSRTVLHKKAIVAPHKIRTGSVSAQPKIQL